MDKTTSDVLRRQFPPNEVGKLPRVTCPDCSDRRVECTRHQKQKCDICKAYVSTAHIHIDYVGHADVTFRLIEADADWSWEPAARDIDPAVLAAAISTGIPDIVRLVIENAAPKFESDSSGHAVGLWIRLTVDGTTRPGYGSCPSGQNDAEKVLIGDALRNAAMRFGVALDLWAKGDRADPTAENATASGGQASRQRPTRPVSGGQKASQASPSATAATAAAPPSQGDPAWYDTVLERAATVAEDTYKALWSELFDGYKAGKCTDQQREDAAALIKARIDDLRAAGADSDAITGTVVPPPVVVPGLDPEDPWVAKLETILSAEDAAAAIADVKGSKSLSTIRKDVIVTAIKAREAQLLTGAAA